MFGPVTGLARSLGPLLLANLSAPLSMMVAGISAPVFLVGTLFGVEKAGSLGKSSLLSHHSSARSALQATSDMLSHVSLGRVGAAAAVLAAFGLAGSYADKTTESSHDGRKAGSAARHRQDHALLHNILEYAARGSRQVDTVLYDKIKNACKSHSPRQCTHRAVRTGRVSFIWPCEERRGHVSGIKSKCRVKPEFKLEYKPNRSATPKDSTHQHHDEIPSVPSP